MPSGLMFQYDKMIVAACLGHSLRDNTKMFEMIKRERDRLHLQGEISAKVLEYAISQSNIDLMMYLASETGHASITVGLDLNTDVMCCTPSKLCNKYALGHKLAELRSNVSMDLPCCDILECASIVIKAKHNLTSRLMSYNDTMARTLRTD